LRRLWAFSVTPGLEKDVADLGRGPDGRSAPRE